MLPTAVGTLATPSSSMPRSLWPVRPVRPSLSSQFIPYGQGAQRPNFFYRYYDLSATPQDRERYHEAHPDTVSSTISPFVPPLYCPCPSQPVLKRDTPIKFLPYQPPLLIMPPYLIFHTPQTPLPPYFSLSSYAASYSSAFFVLSRDIPIAKAILGLSIRNPHREIIWGHSKLLDGATPAPSSLLLIRFFS